jgi:hypothetical protein
MLTSETFKQLDISSIQPRLYINNKDRYKTIFGSFIGFLSLLAISALSTYFIIRTFSRSTLTLIYSKNSLFTPQVDLTAMPLMFGLFDVSMKPIKNPEKTYVLIPELFTWSTQLVNNINTTVMTRTNFTAEKCDIEKHFGEFKDSFTGIGLQNYYCIPPNKNNRTLHGKSGDTVNGYNMFFILFAKCVNGSAYGINDCESNEIITSRLSNMIYSQYYIDYDLDNLNVTNPAITYIRPELFALSSTIYKNIRIFLKNILYDTDYGYVFEEHKQFLFYQNDGSVADYDLRTTGFTTPGQFGSIRFELTEKRDEYRRSYIKLQALIANIGGVVKCILFLSGSVLNFLTRKMYYHEISNSCFSFGNDSNNLILEKKLPKNNDISGSFSQNISSKNIL